MDTGLGTYLDWVAWENEDTQAAKRWKDRNLKAWYFMLFEEIYGKDKGVLLYQKFMDLEDYLKGRPPHEYMDNPTFRKKNSQHTQMLVDLAYKTAGWTRTNQDGFADWLQFLKEHIDQEVEVYPVVFRPT